MKHVKFAETRLLGKEYSRSLKVELLPLHTVAISRTRIRDGERPSAEGEDEDDDDELSRFTAPGSANSSKNI